MSQPSYQSLLREPMAFWAASSDEQGRPVILRVNGVDATAFPELTIFIPEIYSASFIASLHPDQQLTLLATYIPTYESYQYKGTFGSIRAATDEEAALQLDYIHRLTDLVESLLGLSKQAVFDSIAFQPSYAVRYRVQELYNQTPGKGAGCAVSLEENIQS